MVHFEHSLLHDSVNSEHQRVIDLINLGGEFDLMELVGELHDGLVLHLDHPLVAPGLLLQPEAKFFQVVIRKTLSLSLSLCLCGSVFTLLAS